VPGADDAVSTGIDIPPCKEQPAVRRKKVVAIIGIMLNFFIIHLLLRIFAA
jgi:uncharacterized integral membrane protein